MPRAYGAGVQIDLVALIVDEYDSAIAMTEVGVTFVRSLRTEPYGRVAVFLDIAGNGGTFSEPRTSG